MVNEASKQFHAAITALDAAHAEDPVKEPADGEMVPRELLYARRMSEWLPRLVDAPSEALQLAVRGQHLRRWTTSRQDYPAGRAGYHAWRREQARQQSEQAVTILAGVGYPAAVCERVASLVRKENLRSDPEAQALEDTACLVFLSYYFADFAPDYEEEKLLGIVRKTWRKMSPRAHELALQLPFSPAQRELLGRALAAEEG